MRVFVALELAPTWQEKIIKETYPLRQKYRGKWVEQHNLHLTLAFIGEVKENDLPAIIRQLTLVVKHFQAFELALGSIVALPPNNPHLLAFSFKHSSDFLNLQRLVIDGLKKIKVPASAFKPHLTLVRLKQPLFKSALPVIPDLPLKFTVDHISLMQSTLTPKGPIYKRLEALKLTSGVPAGLLRPNIAICVINPKNEVLLIRSSDRIKDWQLPQGGVEKNESLMSAARRELYEEVGLDKIRIILLKENIYQYHWPKKLIKMNIGHSKEGYIGQKQSLAFIRIQEIRPRLNLNPREAAAYKWVHFMKLMQAVSPVRRGLGRLAMVELNKMISKDS